MAPAAKKAPAKKAAAKKAPAKKSVSAMEAARRKFDEDFDKEYGEGVNDYSGEITPYEVISTGCLSLDYSMGVGGYVEGRLYEIWGVDAIGKTTLALWALAQAQKKHPDKLVAVINMEHTFDKPWAIKHGVDISKKAFRLITPESAEDVADQMKKCLRSGLFSMVVLDSIGAMIPEAEKEKNADEATMAIQAKIVTRMVKIAAVEADNTSTVVIMLNQVRANLSYGADTTTGGGFALKHVTTGKLKLSRGGAPPFTVKIPGEDKPVQVGHEIAVLNERNKVAPDKRRASYVLFTSDTEKYGRAGLDRADDAASLGIKTGVIVQGGAWYTFPDGEKVNGKEAVVAHLRENPDVVDDIRDLALATLSETIIASEEASNPLANIEAIEALSEDGGVEGLEAVASKFGSLTGSMAGRND